MALRVVL